LSKSDVEKGFTILLERVDDLQLDVPNALTYLSIFIARAVVDEVLPPAFLLRVDLGEHDAGTQVLRQAQALLKQENASDGLLYASDTHTSTRAHTCMGRGHRSQRGSREEDGAASRLHSATQWLLLVGSFCFVFVFVSVGRLWMLRRTSLRRRATRKRRAKTSERAVGRRRP